MLTKRRALGFKLEAVEGTAETITAAEIIFVEDVKFSPQVESLLRNPHLTTLSRQTPVAGRAQGSMSFRVQMYGGSAAGTAPFWGALIQACGCAETIVASTSVSYKPASSSLKSATVKVFMDGISFRIKGARGTVSAEYMAGQIPALSFTFSGLFEPALDVNSYVDEATLAGSAFPSFLPKPFKAALLKVENTYKAITRQIRWDLGVQLAYTPDANVTGFKRVDITGRNPTGEINVEAVTKATYDFFTKLANKTAVQIQCFTGADDSGNGTGSLNTLTDTTKSWPTNLFATGYKLRDSAGVVFTPTANTATAITVSGTPANGDYIIYQAGKLIETNMPKAVFEGINDGETNGIYDYGIPFGLYLTTADDEIEIKLT